MLELNYWNFTLTEQCAMPTAQEAEALTALNNFKYPSYAFLVKLLNLEFPAYKAIVCVLNWQGYRPRRFLSHSIDIFATEPELCRDQENCWKLTFRKENISVPACLIWTVSIQVAEQPSLPKVQLTTSLPNMRLTIFDGSKFKPSSQIDLVHLFGYRNWLNLDNWSGQRLFPESYQGLFTAHFDEMTISDVTEELNEFLKCYF